MTDAIGIPYRDRILTSFIFDYDHFADGPAGGSGDFNIIHNPRAAFKREGFDAFALNPTFTFIIHRINTTGVLSGEKTYALPALQFKLNEKLRFSQMLSWAPTFPDVSSHSYLVPSQGEISFGQKSSFSVDFVSCPQHSKFRVELRGFLCFPME